MRWYIQVTMAIILFLAGAAGGSIIRSEVVNSRQDAEIKSVQTDNDRIFAKLEIIERLVRER